MTKIRIPPIAIPSIGSPYTFFLKPSIFNTECIFSFYVLNNSFLEEKLRVAMVLNLRASLFVVRNSETVKIEKYTGD